MRVLNIVYVNFSEKWKKTSMLAKKLRFVNTEIPVFFIITFFITTSRIRVRCRFLIYLYYLNSIMSTILFFIVIQS